MHKNIYLATLAVLCLAGALYAAETPKPDAPKATPRPKVPQPPPPPPTPPVILQPTISDVRLLAAEFAKNFKSTFSADHSQMENIGNYVVPMLRNGNIPLNNNPIVETFSMKTGAPVIIFVKSGNDFVAVSSSMSQENGLSARGRAIDPYDPAFRRLMGGYSYIGRTVLFGREFLGEYDLIREPNGRVVGAILVALPLNAER